MHGVRMKHKENLHLLFKIKQVTFVLQESTSAPPWINIKLENPNTSTQYDYRGIYCDVWDQINYQNAFQNYYKKIKTY